MPKRTWMSGFKLNIHAPGTGFAVNLIRDTFVIPEQERLAKRLTENTFADYVCFQNSGTEATEASIKIASSGIIVK